jgi:hypothetical protein
LEQFLAGKSGTTKDYSFSLEVGSESELHCCNLLSPYGGYSSNASKEQ